MQQLTFELAPPEPPSFANFVVGRNGEAVARLAALAEGRLAETVLVLWGPAGAGRTHLLRATVGHVSGRPVAYWAHPSLALDEPPGAGALVAVDDVDLADDDAQGRLFTLFNRLQAAKGQLVASAAAAPARLPLRDDLRTRLGWGLTYELLPLSDSDKPQALARFASERGFRLGPEVIDYLLAHGRRDMTSLVATLAALDRYSLAGKRPVTVPLLKRWLAEESARAQDRLLP
jgi:DnaA family protein